MAYQKVMAIIREDTLDKVEAMLLKLGVHGMSISEVKGYGEYANYYSRDLMVNHTRVEIFANEKEVESIAKAIIKAAQLGMEGDGIVAIEPVNRLFRIRTGVEV